MPSAVQTIANMILPNVFKLKGSATVLSAMERRDASIFEHVWAQTGIAHKPTLVAKERDPWRIGIMTLPAPTEMGDAYLCAFVTKKTDAGLARYFLLEYDYVLATKTTRTQVTERDGQRTIKHGEGPVMTADDSANATGFFDAIMTIVEPKPRK
ncbi:MAG: hypothetical protein JWO36_3196 [Myxococcales bacterium]|nr:hypothetical protein [Myxococcales bacterium]